MSTTSKTKSYAIWTVAGVIALAAIIVGLTHKKNVDTPPHQKPTVITKTITENNQNQKPRIDEAFPVDVLHDDEVDAAGGGDVVDGDDVRVGERRRGPGLAEKTPPPDGVLGLLLRQELQRHEPVQEDVPRLVDDAHAPRAQLLDDLVVGECTPQHRLGPVPRLSGR